MILKASKELMPYILIMEGYLDERLFLPILKKLLVEAVSAEQFRIFNDNYGENIKRAWREFIKDILMNLYGAFQSGNPFSYGSLKDFHMEYAQPPPLIGPEYVGGAGCPSFSSVLGIISVYVSVTMRFS